MQKDRHLISLVPSAGTNRIRSAGVSQPSSVFTFATQHPDKTSAQSTQA